MDGGGIFGFFDYYFWFLPKMRRFKRFEKVLIRPMNY